MSAPSINGLFNTVQVLKTTVSQKTKKILAQIGSVVGDGLTEQDNIALWQWFGFASRPSKPRAGKDAAELFVIRAGNEEYAIAGQDVRDLPIYGALDEGETCLYATGPEGTAQARILLKKNGSITAYTRKGNTEAGTGMMIQIDAEAGAIRLINDKGYGLIIDTDGVKLFAGDKAGITIGGDGNIRSIATQQNQTDGATVVLGSTVVPVINAALTGPTGIAGVASTKVLISTA